MFRMIAAAGVALMLSAECVFAYEPIAALTGDRTIHPGRGEVDVLATREETGGKFGVVISNDFYGGPGRSVSLSGADQSWYVLDGTYEFHIGDKVLSGGPGTFVSVAAGEVAGYISKGEGRLLTVYSPGGFEHFFMDWADRGIGPGPELEALERHYGLTRSDP